MRFLGQLHRLRVCSAPDQLWLELVDEPAVVFCFASALMYAHTEDEADDEGFSAP